MKIVSKYFLKEIFKTYLLTLTAIVGIFSIFHFLDELGNNYPLDKKIEYLALSIPSIANEVFTISILISTIIFFSKLGLNKEIQIFFTGGLSNHFLVKKALIIIFTLSLLSLSIGELFSPYFMNKALQTKAIASSGNFQSSSENFWIKQDSQFISLNIDEGNSNYKDILVFDLNKDNSLKKLISSKNASILNKQLVINKPKVMEVINSNHSNLKEVSEMEILKEKVNISLSSSEIKSLQRDLRTVDMAFLVKAIFLSRSNNFKNNKIISEFFNRITKPFYALGMILISIPFVLKIDRNASLGRASFIGIVLAIGFNLFSKIFNILSLKFGVNIYFASLIPTVLVIVIGYFLMRLKLEKL